ncbi:MAG TPA: LysM peptidoglycan-binding domain-containing protein [Anaerolineales bacterium]|nr:LysM peptidoglycan-binding domain-containing protein [Anaerolineales bacterium]
MRKSIVLGMLFAAACGANALQATSVPAAIKPYLTMTASPSAARPDGLVVSATTPLPVPTPFTYTVKPGDTLGQLALKFNVSLSALMAANPNVDPNSMSIGQTLKIPSPQNLSGASTPTPVPFPVRQITCFPTADRGMWCFVLIYNDSKYVLEDITAQITLMGATGESIASQTATLPLDILASHSAMPLSAYFAPAVPLNARPQVEILTGIQVQPGDPRYLPGSLQNTAVEMDPSGLTAQVNGQVLLAASASTAAKLIWVVAIAYDQSQAVVGVRRWESTSGLSAGGSLPFSFVVSSIAGKISRVELAVEARP